MHNKLALRVTFPLIFLLLSSNFAFAFGIEKYVCPTISAKDKGNDNGKGILTLLMIPGKEMSFFERVIVFGNLVSVSQEKMTAIRVNMFSLLIDGRPNQFIDFLENVSPGIRADLDENVSNARSLWINGRVSYSGVNSDGMFDFTALPAKANLIVPIDVATKSSDVLEFLATFKFESFTGIRASNLIPVVSQVTVKCKKVEGYSQQEHSAWASTVDDIEDVEIEILPGHAMIPALTEQGDLIYVPSSTFMHAVRLISENGSFITSENLITIGGIAGGGALLLKYGRSLSPAGAFLLGLGLSPVAASEYCDMYSGSDGIERFLALSADLQLREASYCPKLAGEIIKMGKEVSDLNK